MVRKKERGEGRRRRCAISRVAQTERETGDFFLYRIDLRRSSINPLLEAAAARSLLKRTAGQQEKRQRDKSKSRSLPPSVAPFFMPSCFLHPFIFPRERTTNGSCIGVLGTPTRDFISSAMLRGKILFKDLVNFNKEPVTKFP